MTYQERHAEKMKLVRTAVAGDQWRQIKSGRIATIVTPLDHHGCLTLNHENGRITRKWADYFADQFEPTGSKAPITDRQRLDWIIDQCAITGGGDGLQLNVFIPHDSEDVRDAIDHAIRSAETVNARND